MRFSQKVISVAKERGKTLVAVAAEAGIPYSTLRTYVQERTEGKPDAPKGIALAKALGVPTDWLFDDSEDPPPPPRLEMPPNPIFPWPPQISWEEVARCLSDYLAEKTFAEMQGLFEQWSKDPESMRRWVKENPELAEQFNRVQDHATRLQDARASSGGVLPGPHGAVEDIHNDAQRSLQVLDALRSIRSAGSQSNGNPEDEERGPGEPPVIRQPKRSRRHGRQAK